MVDLHESPNLKLQRDPLDDLSFVDSLLDLESIERWYSEMEVKKLSCGIEEELGKVSLVGKSEEGLLVSEKSEKEDIGTTSSNAARGVILSLPYQMSMPGSFPFHQQQPNAFAGAMGSQGMMGQHARVQQGQHGFNRNMFPSVTQAQTPYPNIGQNVPQPGNPASPDDSARQFSRSSSDSRGRRPYGRGGRQFTRGRGRSSS